MTNPAKNIDLEVVFNDDWDDFVQFFDENNNPIKLVDLSAASRLLVIDDNGTTIADLTDGSGLTITNDGKITISHTWTQQFTEADWSWSVTISGRVNTFVTESRISMIESPVEVV